MQLKKKTILSGLCEARRKNSELENLTVGQCCCITSVQRSICTSGSHQRGEALSWAL